MEKPEPLASLADTRGIPERMDARGNVVIELDEDAAREMIDDLCHSGIEALTISLMHSYANGTHEQRLKELVAEGKSRYFGFRLFGNSTRIPGI